MLRLLHSPRVSVHPAGLSVLEEQEFKSVETTDILGRLNLFIIISVAPVEVIEIPGHDMIHDGILVEWPAVHVGVKTESINGAEEERLALLPRFARHKPCVACALECIV